MRAEGTARLLPRILPGSGADEEIARHAGHADIVREQIDGSTGLLREASNLPGDMDWSAYVAKLTALAERS